MKYVLLLFLLGSAILDIRSRKIPALWIWGGILVMILYRMYLWVRGTDTIEGVILSFLPGMILYLFSCISEEIGKGDGLLVIATGGFFMWKEHIEMLYWAFLLAAVFSVGILIAKHNLKNRKIAFAPFLFAASGIVLFL